MSLTSCRTRATRSRGCVWVAGSASTTLIFATKSRIRSVRAPAEARVHVEPMRPTAKTATIDTREGRQRDILRLYGAGSGPRDGFEKSSYGARTFRTRIPGQLVGKRKKRAAFSPSTFARD